MSYRTNLGHNTEIVERQRGGRRVFATLDTAAHCLVSLGVQEFRVTNVDHGGKL